MPTPRGQEGPDPSENTRNGKGPEVGMENQSWENHTAALDVLWENHLQMEGHSWENHRTIAEDSFQQAMFDDTGGK